MHGIVTAGTHSGCGKTTVTLGLLAALKKKGLRVQSFKAGPDFIDSGLHRMITRRPSRNLDLWMCGEDYVRDCFKRNSEDADIAVVEGVMGLYDGTLSTAALASRLVLPVVLVVDAYGMAETAGALIQGIRDWGSGTGKTTNPGTPFPNPSIAGVIFNRVASEKHYNRLCAGVRDTKVLGYLPRDLDFEIPHRHLGLTVAEENPIATENLDKLADAVLRCINIDMIIELSAETTALPFPLAGEEGLRMPKHRAQASRNDNKIKIAVAYDRAFCFYYEDNLDLLRESGAEIMYFSPLSDAAVPEEADAVYIGGGYPELHAGELSRNIQMLAAVKKWADSGKTLYAECGGLMYLSKGIHDFEGNFFRMAGVFPFETSMKKGRSKLGYREVSLKEDCILGAKGEKLRGHEFHYSEIRDSAKARENGGAEGVTEETLTHAYSVRNGSGEELHSEGYRVRKTMASYIHLHFGSSPAIARAFINSCKGER